MKVVIVGGGPAGMLAGISAIKSKNEVIIIEDGLVSIIVPVYNAEKFIR